MLENYNHSCVMFKVKEVKMWCYYVQYNTVTKQVLTATLGYLGLE